MRYSYRNPKKRRQSNAILYQLHRFENGLQHLQHKIILVENKDFTYSKLEKLKSRKTIDLLFSEGKSVSKYPLRLVYAPTEGANEKVVFGVSVSKKYFKNASDRNYLKRVLRECYRLNKHLLHENTDKPYAFMFFYQTNELLTYQEIEEKTIQLFEKWVAEKNS
jgi:ribonuclease P protein component